MPNGKNGAKNYLASLDNHVALMIGLVVAILAILVLLLLVELGNGQSLNAIARQQNSLVQYQAAQSAE